MHHKDMYDLLYRRHPRYGALWMVGVETGLRITDLLKLDAKTVLSGDSWTIIEQKTGKPRTIKFTSQTHAALLEIVYNSGLMETDNDKIFYRHPTNKQQSITRQWAHRIIARTASNLGLGDVGAHSMRKIFACNLFRATGSFKRVQNELNHKYPSTTLIYLQDLLPSADGEG
jgi:integrase